MAKNANETTGIAPVRKKLTKWQLQNRATDMTLNTFYRNIPRNTRSCNVFIRKCPK